MNWLVANGILREDVNDGSRRTIPDVDDRQTLQEWFLMNIATTEIENPFDDVEDEITDAVHTLLHSISHCLFVRTGEQCGLAADTLGERIFPNVPATVIYAATTGSLSLRSMLTPFKTRLHPWLSRVREPTSDCLLDSVCTEDPEGTAYDACIHIPETSYEYFNHALDHRLLEGDDGLVRFWMREIPNGMGTVEGAKQDVTSTASNE